MKNQIFNCPSREIMQIKTPLEAVALKYHEGADVPFITAKGKGELAKKIVEIAQENNIHIEENEALVNLLSAEEINAAVPEEAYSALAVIFAFILEREEKL
ncbi:MAG: EscU/YscU/HrcU family type III secretion system export apparatus switch protein [Treponema sp.]|jgi:type III secretion system FlhB-like substrate exporter|nr:EscU/YscU/HrcU family type III secretion system export apparatus switch protein [Treponema sp.]